MKRMSLSLGQAVWGFMLPWARDLGASVVVVEANYDVGGKMVHSGGFILWAAETQYRPGTTREPTRMAWDSRASGSGRFERLGLLFKDITDWSVVDASGVARYRYNDRQQHRAWADNAPLTRQFQLENYVRFARIDGTHFGGGMSRARMAKAMLKLAAKTDIKAGTLSAADRGDPEKELHSAFNPMRIIPGGAGAAVGAPGWVWGGFCLSRCLEFSAREKGIRFILNRHMDEIIREHSSPAGCWDKASYHQVRGVHLEASGRPATAEHAPTIHPREKGSHRTTGGHRSNRQIARCSIPDCTVMCLRTLRARWLDLTAKMQAGSSPV
jgi:hypothetical protein